MKTSNMLLAIAQWLEDPNNEALVSAEDNDDLLQATAESLLDAALVLKKAAQKVEVMEPTLTSKSIDDLAFIAEAFAKSDDTELKKQASVIDELLLTLAATPYNQLRVKAAEEDQIEEIKRKYNRPLSEKTSEVLKAVENAPVSKQYQLMEAPLSTRGCPDHPGAQMARISENVFQCNLDKKIYDYANGYTLMNGDKVPGGDVALQSPGEDKLTSALFDSREQRLGGYKS